MPGLLLPPGLRGRGWRGGGQVILMDHVDWLGQKDIDVLCNALKEQVKVR